jgi:hypothetical protein
MKASDPVLHQQLSHIVSSGRKSTTAEFMVLFTGFYDDEQKARASMVTFDCRPDKELEGGEAINEYVELTMRGLNALLHAASTKGPMEAVLRNKESGKIFEFDSGSFGAAIHEIEE